MVASHADRGDYERWRVAVRVTFGLSAEACTHNLRAYAETPLAKWHLRPAELRRFLCRKIPCRNQSVLAWDSGFVGAAEYRSEDQAIGRSRGGLNTKIHALVAAPPARRLTILAGVATWEREIMLERQREGIAKAKAAGKYKGRPVSIDAAQVRQLSAEMGPAAIAKRLGIARSSVYRALS